MFELVILGTGGATATPHRDNTCFWLIQGNTRILLDCPGSVVHKLKKMGEDPRAIDFLLLTHVHPDHVYGLPSLVHSLMLEEMTLRVLGSQETVDFCRRLLDLFELRHPRLKCRTSFLALEPGKEYQLTEEISLKPIPTPHHASSLAYRFTSVDNKQAWLFSGDTPPYPPLWEEAQTVDVLIHEASAPRRFFQAYPELRRMHTDSFELGALAAKAKVPVLIPCHFFGEVDFSLEEIESEIKENYSGQLIMPHDLERWPEKKIEVKT